jgi:hypothetical protein
VSNVSECLDGRTEDGGRRRRKVHSHKGVFHSLINMVSEFKKSVTKSESILTISNLSSCLYDFK